MAIDIMRGFCLAALLVMAGARAQAISDAERCEAAKNKLAGKYAFCRQDAEAKAIKKGTAPDYSKCDEKFGEKWMAAETKGGGMCPTNGDEAAIQVCVTAHADNVAAALSGGACTTGGRLVKTGQTNCYGGAGGPPIPCTAAPGEDGEAQAGLPLAFVDNGDGTITDVNTGLIWEKLSDDGSVHDKGNTYNWLLGDVSPSPYYAKLQALNSGGGFAGYTDWRVPNIRELISIGDFEPLASGLPAEFNSGCSPGCTVLTCSCPPDTPLWSSTTCHDTWQGFAVVFWQPANFGGVNIDRRAKTEFLGIRAVRGGL